MNTDRTNYRADIQGLRAVAVVAVILDHAFGWPIGGFVGVDVFFVISGFLITRLLLREYELTGSISPGRFYRRRVKRILPAAMLVIIVTVAVGYLLFATGRATQTLVDSVFALLFSANWRFAALGTDYFQSAGPVSPLQHYWSLGVEEQFYLVWPWMMLAVLVIAGGRARRSRTFARNALLVLVVLVTVSSFVWSIVETAGNPTVAYFSTFSRAWELSIGALLAISAPTIARAPAAVRAGFGWVGLVAIVLSVVGADAGLAYPAPGVAIPVIGAALVIASGIGGVQRSLWPLTNRVSGYLGDASYSLYLWHWPILVFVASAVPEPTVFTDVAAVVIILGIALAAFHFVENPIRRSRWLEKRSITVPPTPRDRPRAPQIASGITLTVATVLALALVVSVAVTRAEPPSGGTAESPGATVPSPDPAANAPLGPELSTIADEIDSALLAEEWPELTPRVDQLYDDAAPTQDPTACAQDGTCGSDDTRPSIIIFGDSTGSAFLPTLRTAFGSEYRIRALTLASCPSIDIDIVWRSADIEAECLARRADALEKIRTGSPAMVIILNSYSTAVLLKSFAQGEARQAEWAAGLQRTVEQITPYTPATLIVASPPRGKLLMECATPLSTPADCVSEVPGLHNDIAAAEQRVTGPTLHYIDTKRWYCNSQDVCPSFADGTPLKIDAVHMTSEWATKVAPAFREQVLAALAE